MYIVHLNTHDIAGGAAKVAWRLAERQRAAGHLSTLLVGIQTGTQEHASSFPADPDPGRIAEIRSRGLLYCELQGSHSLVTHDLVRAADLLHLHNLHGGYFNPFSLSSLSHLKPVVWTLHDMQAITGHCAHSFECDRWESGCGSCPHLDVEPVLSVDSSAALWKLKAEIYAASPLTVVVPSQWLKSKVERSILQDHPLRLIYNGVDTKMFAPKDRRIARAKFGIPEDAVVVGSVAHGGALKNQWKGGEQTLGTMHGIWREMPELLFASIGGDPGVVDRRIIQIPRIDDEHELAEAYAVLDAFLYTPRADNCPLVVLEALACGVPIATVDVGGIPELVQDGVEGVVVAADRPDQLVRHTRDILLDPRRRELLSMNARQRAVDSFDLEKIAAEYESTYFHAVETHQQGRKQSTVFVLNDLPSSVISAPFVRAELAKLAMTDAEVGRGSAHVGDVLRHLKDEALALSAGGRPDDAATVLGVVVEESPADEDAVGELSTVFRSAGRRAEALALLSRTVQHDPSSLQLRKLLSGLCSEMGLVKESLEVCFSILTTHPDEADTLLLLAMELRALGKLDDAIWTYHRVQEVDPGNQQAARALALLERSHSVVDNGKRPDISIVVATKNRAELLDAMLTSLYQAGQGTDCEIVAVVGESTDHTWEVLQKHRIQRVFREQEVFGEGKQPWSALYNFGFAMSTGKWLMYASDDTVFEPGSLTRAFQVLNRQSPTVAGGILFYKNVCAEPGWDEFGIDFTLGQRLLMNYGLLRSDDVFAAGGLDERYRFYCADGDLCLKLYEKGRTLIPLDGCFVTHNNVLDSQKRHNFLSEKGDIDTYQRRWSHFVPADDPNPRRLLWRIVETQHQMATGAAGHNPLDLSDSECEDSRALLRSKGVWNDGLPLRLHLGCGEMLFPGYVNIDYPPSEQEVPRKEAAEVFADITRLSFPEGSVDEVRLHHVFEHFRRVDALALLVRWHRWLKTGGRIHIETPDILGSALTIASNPGWKITMGIVRHLAGDQAAGWAYHRDHWFPERFVRTLTALGFTNIRTRQTSWDREPFLSNVEVVATKNGPVAMEQQLRAAEGLLWDSTVSESEHMMWEVWKKQLRLAFSAPTLPHPVPQMPGDGDAPSNGGERAQ